MNIILLLIAPIILFADMVWPALYLEVRMFSWWAISIGMIIEIVLIKYIFCFNIKRIVKIVFVANIISAILGLVLIPLSGIIIELFPAGIYNYFLHWGSFNPITWGLTYLVASYITTYIEYLVYKKLFLVDIDLRNNKFIKLLCVNLLSVGIAFISLWLYPLYL